MEQIHLASVIEQAISRFNQNRIGEKPALFVMIAPALSPIPWQDRSLDEFVRLFLYEVLLSNDSSAIVEIALRRKTGLKDLNAFVGIRPSGWVQLRVAGRGLKVMEHLIDELFAEVGYPCEEWLGAQNSRLGIFGNKKTPELKMIFGLELSRSILKCDLLLPVTFPLSCLTADETKLENRELN